MSLLPLPNSKLKVAKAVKFFNGMNWVPIFCANCGADGGMVPEEHCDFAFYLCGNCFEKHGQIDGTYAEPDALFWEKVKQAQIEKFGRELNTPEVVEALKNDDHILSKLAKDRPKG